MELKNSLGMVLVLYVALMVLGVTSRPHSSHLNLHQSSQRHHSSHHHHNPHHSHQSRQRNLTHSQRQSSSPGDVNENDGRDGSSSQLISGSNPDNDNYNPNPSTDDNDNQNEDETNGRVNGGDMRLPISAPIPAPGKIRMSGGSSKPWRQSRDDEEYDYEEEGGRHAYLMTTNHRPVETPDEDEAITSAFEKHMRPHQQHQHQNQHQHSHNSHSSQGSSPGDSTKNKETTSPLPEHDVYAYQLPSNLWFIVRYAKDKNGHVDKYMNIVDSFTNYLDKLEKGVRTVSVNVKGVETVFRLTVKHKPYQPPGGSSSSSPSSSFLSSSSESDTES